MMNPNNKTAKQKLKTLWADKRSYTKRLIYSGSAMLAFCFTFIFFGPLEMVAFGGAMLNYTYKQMLLPMVLVALAVFAAGTLLIALLRGRIFNYVVTTISAVTVCGYLQAAFLNGELGSLAGETVDWAAHKGEVILNIAIWAVIFIAMFFLLYISRKVWKKAIVFIAILVVVMQLAPTLGIITGAYSEVKTDEISEYFLSTEGMFEYSKEKNTFVFVLDYMDYDFIEQIKEQDADFFNKLDGFTEYTDALSVFGRTKPALNNMLTGCTELPYNTPANEFLTNSWLEDGKNLLKDLSEQNYSISFYANLKNLFGDTQYPSEYVDNVYHNQSEMNYPMLIKKMLYLSTYRYSPISLKPFFWSDTNYYNDGVYDAAEQEIYTTNDSHHAIGFADAVAEKTENAFKFYHFYGSHPPHKLGADGYPSDTPTDAPTQTMGCFNILYRVFDRMKELGIYEDATIIITADHGNVGKMAADEFEAMRIGLFYKPSGSAGTPLKQSAAQVSSANLAATILKEAGADYSAYGTPFDEVAEETQVERVFYRNILSSSSWKELSVEKYSIKGSSRDESNWQLVDTYDVKYNFYG